MTNKILSILGVVIIVMVSANLYQGCTSSGSEKQLNELIDAKEKEIGDLKKGYAGIIEREQALLVEIGQLKDRVTALRLDIAEGETQLDEVKNELIDIDSAIAIIHEHTTRSVSRGIAILGDTGGGPGEGND